MMMFYRRRASPKHRYDIIEVDYGGGGHRTRLRDQEINCCVFGVPPAPVYKGVEEGEGPALLGAPQGESSSHREQDSNPSKSRSRSQGKGRGKRRKEGALPLPLVQFGLVNGGGITSPSPLKPNKAHILPSEFP